MDYREIQDVLNHDIEKLTRLRDSLSDRGKTLSADEKRTIRSQFSIGWLVDMHNEQRWFFEQGNSDDLARLHENIVKALEQLS